MADLTVDGGALADYDVDTTTLSDAAQVQRIELVTAIEAGASTNLAQLIGEAYAAGLMSLNWVVRRDTPTNLPGVADNEKTLPIVDGLGRLHVVLAGSEAMPIASALADSISSAPDTSRIMNGNAALTPKWAVIDAATSGDNTIVAAVASKKIRVHQAVLVASAAVTARFESGTGGTAKTGQMQLGTAGGCVLPWSPMGWFETAAGVLLNLELSGAISVDGVIGYTEV